MILFKNNAFYSNIIKFIGYVTCFSFGKATAIQHLSPPPKNIIIGLIVLPFFIVAIGDNSLNQSQFFPNSNNFTYWGLCSAILYYTSYHTNPKTFKISIIIVLAYIAVGSSLGILVAFILSIFVINRKNKKLMLVSIMFGVLLFIGIVWSDMAIFKRIRNIIDIYNSISWNDWLNLADLDLYELQQTNSVEENISDYQALLER